MGKEFFRRPLMVANATGGSTVSSFDDLRVAGALAVVGNLGFYGVAASTRPASVAAPTTAGASLQTAVNALIARLETLGLLSTA